MQNYIETVISQYGNSTVLLSLIESFNDANDPAADFDAFYDNIWNLDTAIGIGLDIWGRIVGVSRVLKISNTDFFGFNTLPAKDFEPFGQAPFSNGNPVTTNFTLTDNAFRTLIYVKAAANIAGTTAPALNSLLGRLFATRGRCYVNDLGSMRMRYTFEFYLKPYELSILVNSGVIPHPTGVAVLLLQQPPLTTFGFTEAGPLMEPFGQGTFLPNGAVYVS